MTVDEYKTVHENTKVALWNYAFLICGDEHLAEDAVQDAFLKFYERLDKIANGARANRFLFVVVRNFVLNQLRSEKRLEPLYDKAEELIFDDRLDAVKRVALAALADRKLTPRQRLIWNKRYLSNMTMREIGKSIGTSAGTVNDELKRVIAYLREGLGNEGFGPEDFL